MMVEFEALRLSLPLLVDYYFDLSGATLLTATLSCTHSQFRNMRAVVASERQKNNILRLNVISLLRDTSGANLQGISRVF